MHGAAKKLAAIVRPKNANVAQFNSGMFFPFRPPPKTGRLNRVQSQRRISNVCCVVLHFCLQKGFCWRRGLSGSRMKPLTVSVLISKGY